MKKQVVIPYDRLGLLCEAGDFTIGAENNAPVGGGYAHIQTENVENEVTPSEVDLSSFEPHKQLVNKIWSDEDTINPKVRIKLLEIADDFWDTVNISWLEPEGVILAGSICNYNWSKYSDIDLHLVVDFEKIDKRTDFVQEYFDSKKNEWNNEHENLKLYSFPVEVYVQDVNAEGVYGGIFDLENNKWIKHPDEAEIYNIDDDESEIKNKVAKFMTKIDDLNNELDNSDSMESVYTVGKKAKKLLKHLNKMRKYALQRKGEGDPLNLVYKCLRRTEYLDKLWDISSNTYDKINSIYENILSNKLFINEEVVADGNSEHNVYAKRWKQEREDLKVFLIHNGKLMTSKENGKQYFVYYDDTMSELVGNNYCVCLQYNPLTMEAGGTVYFRALDKFTEELFTPEYDTRGKDNITGTNDDIRY